MINILYAEPGNYTIHLAPGKYIFECWGAQGGYVELEDSGRGAYVSGELVLDSWEWFYLYVGEKGMPKSNLETFNGGGAGFQGSQDGRNTLAYSCSGGGATDIRLHDGIWSDTTSLLSRIMVAAGGGGEVQFKERDFESKPSPGGYGGIFDGGNGNHSKSLYNDHTAHVDACGGTQTKGGSAGGGNDYTFGKKGEFGKGGSANQPHGDWPSSGGGSGYFGGGSGGVSDANLGSGAGGSSFVSGKEGCQAIMSGNSEETFIFDGSVHVSNLKFENIIMNGGNESFLSPSGKEEVGHFGDGAIRIRQLNIHTWFESRKLKFFDFFSLSIFQVSTQSI